MASIMKLSRWARTSAPAPARAKWFENAFHFAPQEGAFAVPSVAAW